MTAPTFYCENCKKEVSSNDKVCPSCGRFFNDVRCPRCNHSGEADSFQMGCPKCGYLNPEWLAGAMASASGSEFIEILNPAIFADALSPPETPAEKESQPPAWVFLTITIGLGTVCAALVYLFIR